MGRKKFNVVILLLFVLVLGLPIQGNAKWREVNGSRKFYNKATKSYVTSSWKCIKKRWYYFDEEGCLQTGRICVRKKHYYVDEKKGRITSSRVGDYYYGKKGVMVKSRWVKLDGQWFYFGEDGRICTGQVKIGDKTYYIDKKKGRICSYWVDGHYYKADGSMATQCWIEDSYVNRKGVITKGNKNPENHPTQKEIRLLGTLVYLEAGNQSYYGKKCVASVVVNRIKSSRFPNTLKGVIYQSGQFTPALNGSLDRLNNGNGRIQADSLRAAEEVLRNGSILKGYYFFNGGGGRLKIGDHYFS
ncbi:MAG: cell wall hydrolase [Eubacteriales bacterium]|nr:cell wall hydrolase [Eubacteriales bacterium]